MSALFYFLRKYKDVLNNSIQIFDIYFKSFFRFPLENHLKSLVLLG